jgi:hypothetical protein
MAMVFITINQWLQIIPYGIRVEVFPVQEAVKFVIEAKHEREVPEEVLTTNSLQLELATGENPAEFPDG